MIWSNPVLSHEMYTVCSIENTQLLEGQKSSLNYFQFCRLYYNFPILNINLAIKYIIDKQFSIIDHIAGIIVSKNDTKSKTMMETILQI